MTTGLGDKVFKYSATKVSKRVCPGWKGAKWAELRMERGEEHGEERTSSKHSARYKLNCLIE